MRAGAARSPERGWRVKAWIIALGAMVVAAALTSAPVVGVPSSVVDLGQTAAATTGCGEVTFGAGLHTTARRPLVDVWGLTNVTATMTSPTIEVAPTSGCHEGAVVTGGALVSNPGCEEPWRVDAEPDMSQAPLESRCGGTGWVIAPWSDSDAIDAVAPGEAVSHTYLDWALPMGRSGLVRGDQWCLDAEYWIEERWSAGDAATLDSPAAEVVEGDLCVETRPAESSPSPEAMRGPAVMSEVVA